MEIPPSLPGTLAPSQAYPGLGQSPGIDPRFLSPATNPYGYGMGAPGYGQGTQPAVFDPITLFLGLKRRWFLALILGVILGGVAAAITWHVWPPDVWVGQSSVHVNPTREWIINRPESPKSQAEITGILKYHASLLRSYTVISTALNQQDVQDLPTIIKMNKEPQKAMDWVLSNLTTDYGADQTVRVFLKGEDPETIRRVLDAIVDAYFDKFVKKEGFLAGRIERLNSIYKRYYGKVVQKREDLYELAKNLGAKDPETIAIQHQHALNKLADYDKELNKHIFEQRRLDRDLSRWKKRVKQIEIQPISESEVEEKVLKDSEVDRLTQEVEAKRHFLTELEPVIVGGKESSIYKEAKQDLDSTFKRLLARKRKVRPLAEEEIRETNALVAQLKVNDLEEQIANIKEYEFLLQEDVDQLIKDTRKINADSVDMDNIRAEIADAEGVVKRIAPQLNDLRVELEVASPQVELVDKAWANPPGIGRKQIMATCTAGLGGFAFALLWVSWREFRARRINTLDEIIHGLGLRLVGTLPAIPDQRGRLASSSLTHGSFWPNYLIESVDTTRTMLLHAARVESIRSVMIASAQSGEGKTSLAIQLAASLARAGRKTLLIDGDLRNPAIHFVFNSPAEPGFSELLRGEVAITAAIQPTSIRGLWIIPGGKWTSQTTEGLAQEGARTLLHRLKDEFDFIVLDSSPALMVVDALLLGQQVDATIISIMQGVSHSPSVYSAQQRLETLGVRILGAVVNGVAGAKPDYQLAYNSKYSEDIPSSEQSPE